MSPLIKEVLRSALDNALDDLYRARAAGQPSSRYEERVRVLEKELPE